jgi:hypothetical protein
MRNRKEVTLEDTDPSGFESKREIHA